MRSLSKLFSKKVILYVVIPILLITAISYPALQDLFKPGHYTSHDSEGHIIRMQEFYRAFTDGHFPTRWSQRLYYGYGYPFFNFNYPLVYYSGLPVMLLGGSATLAIEVELITTFVLSGILMFLYLRRKVSTPLATLGGVLYLYMPYRLLNLYVRGSAAEAPTFIFAPLILWGIEAITDKKRLSIPLTALVIFLLGISHNISALILFAFYFGYTVFKAIQNKSVQTFLRSTLAFVLGIMMASFFLVPALMEKGLTFLDTTIAKDYPDHFLYPMQIISSGWDYGASIAGPDDGLSFNLGYLHLVLAGLGLIAWKLFGKKVKDTDVKTIFYYCLLMLLVALFFMFPPSKFFWDTLPLLPFVQFPWRFIMLTVPTLTILSVLGLHVLSKKYNWSSWLQWLIAAGLIAVSLFLSRNQWYLSQPLFWENPTGDSIPGTTTWADEQATQWFQPKPTSAPDQKVKLLSPEVATVGADTATQTATPTAEIQTWKTQYHRYQINTEHPAKVVEHTMYYPGWRAWVNGEEVEIDYQDEQHPGKIVFNVDTGEHTVETELTEAPLRKTVDLISLATLIGVLGWIILKVKE